ncbi:MAG: M56 family metallopeptidase, partial [Oscillospiraceae bacterium]|nr:M56 family metallopeptidase [Oscillospiraceae bacterium]
MTNIWGFLTQTLQVSSMAVVLIAVKFMLKDKLPPRWQYSVWSLLAVTMVIPAGRNGMYIFRRRHVWLQAAKTIAETGLNSRYTVAESVVFNNSFLPQITGKPASITDILFVVYSAGIAVCFVRYMTGYLKLGTIIGKAPYNPEFQRQTDAVAEKYSLPTCRVKAVNGLVSAFVYGVVQPVLVLPAETETDDKVILHELLHLKYKDLWQKVMWSFFKALHWPNPFMHFIFSLINNDMESLCDSRVLEKLEGEERREYGRILLSMTNEKYPSAFGTTSISNGSAFISERIKTIARYKKYPKGMGIVAGCIIAMLFPLTVRGESSADEITSFNLAKEGFEMQLQIEECRMTACGTVAGAMDMYAKAIFEVEEYMLAVKPTTAETKEYALPDREKIWKFGTDHMYYVVSLKQQDENTYTAGLMFKNYDKDSSDGEYGTHFYVIPVKIIKENGWKVYQTGDYKYYYLKNIIDSTYSPPRTED